MEVFTLVLGLVLRLAMPLSFLLLVSHYLKAWDAHRVL